MKRSRYSLLFAALSAALTVAALASYRAISAIASGQGRDDASQKWPDDTLPTREARMLAVPARAYAALAAADSSWRSQYAREYTLDELRARGDGRRTPRQAMQDRVYRYTRSGNRARAIWELERWVGSNPRDADALLSLARLLNETGRAKDAIPRYRQALAIEAEGK
ncbi:MAG TPA: hypothetical protein VFT29_20160 [Gemmatimonadaceae bacterium]|nr:hypothetical protein [Gemmatimonadaceae bacterium]